MVRKKGKFHLNSCDCSWELVKRALNLASKALEKGLFGGCSISLGIMSIGRKGMDASNQKSIERVVSQRALQMGSSFPCQICVVGFLCGVCLATFFLAALTSLGTFAFGGISFSASSNGITSGNSSSAIISEWNLLNFLLVFLKYSLFPIFDILLANVLKIARCQSGRKRDT